MIGSKKEMIMHNLTLDKKIIPQQIKTIKPYNKTPIKPVELYDDTLPDYEEQKFDKIVGY
jgi:hypothetical protein